MQHRKAFTMMEVLIALFVLSSSIYVLSGMQLKQLFRVAHDRDEIEKIFLLKQRFYTLFCAPLTEIKPKKEKVEDPEVVFKYESLEISPKSLLSDYKNRMQLVAIDAVWTSRSSKRHERMIAIIGKPQPKAKV